MDQFVLGLACMFIGAGVIRFGFGLILLTVGVNRIENSRWVGKW